MQPVIESQEAEAPSGAVDRIVRSPAGASAPKLKTRLLRGGAWAVFGKCWNSLLIVAANALLARVLSLADFAAFLLAFSCVTVLGNLGTLGLNIGVVRYVAESLSLGNVSRARHLALRSWLISAVGSLAVAAGFLVALLSAGAQVPLLAPLMPIALQVALWIVLHAGAVLQGETFRGFHRIGPASVFGTPYNLPFLFGLTWLAISGQGSLPLVMWLVLACQGVNLLIGSLYLLSPLVAGQRFEAGPSPALPASRAPSWSEMLRDSLPLAVTTATSLLMAQLDLWIVAAFCSTADLAIYGAVTRLMLLVSTPVNIVNNFVPPLVADLHARGQRRQLEDVLRSTATLATAPALGAFLVVVASGGWLLALFYGEAFRPGASVLIVLASGQLINAWCGSAGCALSMTHQQRSAMLAIVASGLCLLALGPLAAHAAGMLGVALASALATAFQKLLLCWLVWRLLGIRAYGALHFGNFPLRSASTEY